jgi:hypothetical protein
MFNIAELVPPPESVPPIPGTQSSFNITELIDTDRVPPIPRIPSNSVSNQFPELQVIPF